MTKSKGPRLEEVAPGEIRKLCWACDTPLRGREIYCAKHKNHLTKNCQRCGKATRGTICADCRKVVAREPKAPVHPSQVKGGKRFLTEHDRPLVEKWWREGLSSPEIAERLGLSTVRPSQTVTGKRFKNGWNLPHRAPWAVERARKMAKKQNKRKIPA